MMSDVCKHCSPAPCLEVCPTGAIFRTEFDPVVVQQDICNGCGYCMPACPFGVVEVSLEDGKAHKCTCATTACFVRFVFVPFQQLTRCRPDGQKGFPCVGASRTDEKLGAARGLKGTSLSRTSLLLNRTRWILSCGDGNWNCLVIVKDAPPLASANSSLGGLNDARRFFELTLGSGFALISTLTLSALVIRNQAQAAAIVVPNALASQEGNSNNTFAFGDANRYQQVYASSEFSSLSGPALITGISFRPDAQFGFAFSFTIPNISINMSTTSSGPGTLNKTEKPCG